MIIEGDDDKAVHSTSTGEHVSFTCYKPLSRRVSLSARVTTAIPMLSSMLAAPRPLKDAVSISDAGSYPVHDSATPPPHFAHTRALLSTIARQYKPPESYDSDQEADEFDRLPSAFVTRVVSLLDHEHEEELKPFLKSKYPAIDNDMVRSSITRLLPRSDGDHVCSSWNNMSSS